MTHFHADHFGGIPFLMLDAQFFSKRTQPLTIVGPPGLGAWYLRGLETAFPGSSATRLKFELSLIELQALEEREIAGVRVRPHQVQHGNPGGPFVAYRLQAEGRTIAYTGDTEWTDELIAAGRDVDLFIAEAYFFDKKVKFHLDLDTLVGKLPLIRPRRLVLTHMSDAMLARVGSLPYKTAFDGMVIEL